MKEEETRKPRIRLYNLKSLKKKGGKIYEENLECSFESNHCCSFGTFGCIQRTRHEQRWSLLANSPQRQTVKKMRKIDLIVIHCSATCEDRPFTGQALEAAHRRRGFDGTGYHFYIRRDGQILTTRPVERAGAHARGYNAHSIGIAYEGGLDHYGNPKDTRTEWQRHSLRVLVRALLMDYPEAKVAGHRDLSPDLNNNGEVEPMEWTKQCPCFEVKKEKW